MTFECQIDEGIACIRLRRGAFVLGTDLEEKQHVLDVFEELERSDEVRAVLLFNAADAYTRREHEHYVASLARLRDSVHWEQATMLLERQDNALDQYALLAARYDKLLVSCLVGEIATPFFGLSLTSDLRLAVPGMRFHLSHVDLGVPPMGGLGFLLPHYIGRGRAAEYLLSGGTIDAHAARELGLVNAILTPDSFETDCVAWVQRILVSGTAHITATRRLIYRDVEAFGAYLQEESKLRRQVLHQSKNRF